MSNRANRKSAEEQYRLILECRSSGMSDQQWCLAHDINPGTFYNWVKRLRRKGGFDIPAPSDKDSYAPAPKQDVVRMEILHEVETIPTPAPVLKTEPAFIMNEALETSFPTIQIRTGNLQICLSNEVDPRLLSQILCSVGGF